MGQTLLVHAVASGVGTAAIQLARAAGARVFGFFLELRPPSVVARERLNLVLDEPVPVHLDYRTAFTEPKARTQFRRDIYGRDARIWKALENAGVALRAVRS